MTVRLRINAVGTTTTPGNRLALPHLQQPAPSGYPACVPSAIAIKGQQHFTAQGMQDFEIPHALTPAEIDQIIGDYGQAARNALEAGFDGVELHAANGYLPNQFLAESANQRTDVYGGSIANNCRFILEVMQVLTDTVGGDKNRHQTFSFAGLWRHRA